MTDTNTPTDPFDLEKNGSALLTLAVEAVHHAVTHDKPKQVTVANYSDALQGPGAAFVTLKKSGSLRGCIGSLEAFEPLLINIADNAHGAAMRDSRFSSVTADEFPSLHVSLSILSPLSTLPFSNETDFLKSLRPGVDGVVIAGGGKRSTFLPQVWDDLPKPRDFIQALKQKGGFAEELTPENHQAWHYHVTDIGPIGLGLP